MSVCGGPATGLPALAALPLAAQANLLLLLRAAPHRFTSGQRTALLASVAQLEAGGACGAGLLQLLTADASGARIHAAVLPCPDFLFTPEPCFPWAPVLADQATAAALHQRLAAAALHHEMGETGGDAEAPAAKRHADGEAEPGSASKRPRQVAHAAPLAAAAAADAELQAVAVTVQRALAAHAGGGTGELSSIPAELHAALGTLMLHAAAGTAAGSAALHTSGLDSLADDALLLLLLQELVAPASSFARCSAAAGCLLLPRLQGLQGAAHRDLAAAVEHVAASNPRAFIAACLQPLLSSPFGLSKHQAELISGALKAALPGQLLPEVLAAACSAPPAAAGAAPGSGWNEHTVGVLQAALNAKPTLPVTAVAQLAGAMRTACTACAELAASPKFAKLALTVVKQYATQAGTVKAQLQDVAAACTSFMAKSLAAAVAKL
ncbi:hypothetical protein ABPG75_012291 [Micractinium tetrahymenae]